jgi:cell division protease FtsH
LALFLFPKIIKSDTIDFMSKKQSKKNQQNNNKKPSQKRVVWSLSLNLSKIILGLLVVILLSSMLLGDKKKETEIPLSQLVAQISEGRVKQITEKGNNLEIVYQDDTKAKTNKEPGAALSETLTNYGLTPAQIASIPVVSKQESGFMYWFFNLVPIILPILIVAFFFYMLSKQMNSAGGMKAMSFGQSKARIQDPSDEKNRITFDQVAGNEIAKSELGDIVDFLKVPEKYFAVGAKIPKGVLLTGDPGTGKTLLARAVAGEARVPFFHLSGSEFVEMFVGVGASRVRDLFDQAKKASPSIMFIDEIDAVGRSRGVGIGGGNDEREQTLNQILVEMDGFEPTDKVIVLAATNRADVLDSALLRPGRFDRTVYLELPDRKDREAILNIHALEKPLAENVDLKLIATRTPGFSGADLESLMNEAAISTAKNGEKIISQESIIKSIEKVMIGPERASHLHTPLERKIVAYHEAGHAILSSVLPNADPVHKVTIIARGSAGGYTLHAPIEERKLTNRAQFLDDIVVSLGGYVAEKMMFGDVTTGPSNDLQVSTKLARNMVTKWGMSDVLGPVAYAGNGKSMFGDDGVKNSDISSETQTKIDDEVTRIMTESLKHAEENMTKYKNALVAVAEKLLEVETLEQEEYHTLIAEFGLNPKTT